MLRQVQTYLVALSRPLTTGFTTFQASNLNKYISSTFSSLSIWPPKVNTTALLPSEETIKELLCPQRGGGCTDDISRTGTQVHDSAKHGKLNVRSS
jgi:hypothetical protein